MKRNRDFMKGLLQAFEETEDPYLDGSEIAQAAEKLGETNHAVIEHHMLLLIDEGLITEGRMSGHYRLTARGHDALIRDGRSSFFS